MKTTFSIFFLLLLLKADATIYYFSTTGNDANSGTTTSAPFASIAKFNAVFATALPGDQFLFKRGDTWYGTLNITKDGTEANPIIVGAYGTGAQPIITGMTTVSAWTAVAGQANVYESTDAVSGLSTCNSVTMNGVMQECGRFPNITSGSGQLQGYLLVGSTGLNTTAKTFTDVNAPGSTTMNLVGAQVINRSENTTYSRLYVTAHSGNTFTYTISSGDYTWNQRYYFFSNHKKLLDLKGEWAYDTLTHKLAMNFGGDAPSAHVVKLATLNRVLTGPNNTDYITFDNLTIEGGNTETVYFNYNTGLKFNNCTIINSGKHGIQLDRGVKSVMTGNTIRDFNNFGIRVTLYTGKPTQATIRGNTLRRGFMFAGLGNVGLRASAAIQVANNVSSSFPSEYSVIEENVIDSMGFIGIKFYEDNFLIRRNHISNHCLRLDDAGAVYAYNGNVYDGTYGGANFNRRIVGNIITKGGHPVQGRKSTATLVVGIYLDNNVNGVVIDSNTTANNKQAGIYLHDPFNVVVTNNKIYDFRDGGICVFREGGESPATGLRITKNEFLSREGPRSGNEQTLVYFKTTSVAEDGDFSSWGVMDSNWFASPVDLLTNFKFRNNLVDVFTTFADWKVRTAFDDNSVLSSKTYLDNIASLDSTRIEINPSSVPITVSLDKRYITPRGTVFTTSLTLQPYTSELLMQDGAGVAANAAPFANAGADITVTLPTNSVTLTGSGLDNDGAIVSYAWTKISGPAGSALSASNAASVGLSGLVEGSYVYRLTVTDNAGATATDDIQIIVLAAVVDNPPSISLIAPTTNSTYAAGTSITLSAKASDPENKIDKVEFYNNGQLVKTERNAPYTWTWTNMGAGNYLITAKVYDKGGNVVTSPARAFNIGLPPTVKMTVPSNRAKYNAPATITLSAVAKDSDGTISQVQFYSGTTLLATDVAAPFTYNWTGVGAGSRKITAVATDNSGRQSTSAPVYITVK